MSGILSDVEQETLLYDLEERFKENMDRHPEMSWAAVLEQLMDQPEILVALYRMENTGGQPDIIGDDYVFVDCAPESPKGRRKVCYDRPALEARKKYKPDNDAVTLAEEIGIELLTEEEYRTLQTYGEFDLKTSTWVKTPKDIRELGGAIFCDRRYDTVFTYHNNAETYYSSRGFRGKRTF